jgi:hypothetical protein
MKRIDKGIARVCVDLGAVSFRLFRRSKRTIISGNPVLKSIFHELHSPDFHFEVLRGGQLPKYNPNIGVVPHMKLRDETRASHSRQC